MPLDESQKSVVSSWIQAGLKLADIQKRLDSELGVRMTYMEVRLLVDDLKLVPKDPEPVKPPPDLASALPAAPAAPAPAAAAPPGPEGTSRVVLSVDQVTRPGALVSGNVIFSDGQKATWYLDQMGRLGMAPAEKGYRPLPADVEEFQVSLERELARLGM